MPCLNDRLSVSIVGRTEIGGHCLSHILSTRGARIERCLTGNHPASFADWADDPAHVVILECTSAMDGLEKYGGLRSLMPRSRIVLLCDSYDLDSVREAFARGVDGVVPTRMSTEALFCVIEMLSFGEKVLPPQLTEMLVAEGAGIIDQDARRYLSRLSDKEVEVLQCLVTGDANKQIADRLTLTDTMVKVYIRGILRKLNVHNRTQAAIWAVNHIVPRESSNGERVF